MGTRGVRQLATSPAPRPNWNIPHDLGKPLACFEMLVSPQGNKAGTENSSCTFTTYVQGIGIQCPRGKNGTILSCQLFWSEIKISLDHLDVCILPSENLVY